MDNVKVVFEDLPCEVGGCIVKGFDDGETYYTIIINARLSAERQKKTFEHEITHIKADDFERVKEVGISIVEHEAHERAGFRQ